MLALREISPWARKAGTLDVASFPMSSMHSRVSSYARVALAICSKWQNPLRILSCKTQAGV